MRNLFILITFFNLLPIFSQPRFLHESLYPYRLNRITYCNPDNMPFNRIRIFGRNYKNDKILLFETDLKENQDTVDCYVYIDDDIYTLKAELSSNGRSPFLAELAVELNPYRIAVYTPFKNIELNTNIYHIVGSLKDLGIGDVYVLESELDAQPGEQEIEQMLAGGIHLIASESAVPPLLHREHEWTGSVIILKSLSSSYLETVLKEKEKEFISFKEQYAHLVSKAEFHVLDLKQDAGARLQDIARTLEEELFTIRISLPEKMILATFYISCLITTCFIKNKRIHISLLVGLLALFFLFFIIYPEKDKMITMRLNTMHKELKELRFEQTEQNSPSGTHPFQEILLEEESFSERKISLNYSIIYSYRRTYPLGNLLDAELIKFNQYPLIMLERGLYLAQYNNPLKLWSLHEPE